MRPMDEPSLPDSLDPEAVASIFYRYVAVNSETGTARENAAADFVISSLRGLPYFTERPEQLALEPLPDDPFGRSIAWALVRGAGPRTVVLIHHLDVVGVEDFRLHGPLAFDPEALARALRDDPAGLDEEARADLASGLWAFGRGSADMKAGGAAQIAAMAACAGARDLPGSVLLLAVPDEEGLSGGMRAAAPLLSRLKRRYGLEYALMLNAEPHQRKDPGRLVLSGGSIGKLLAFAYVRGILAHAGKSYEGFNPLAILSRIIDRSELSMDLADADPAAGETAPPPTWLMARDGKEAYDASMPLSAFGCLSVLTMRRGPEEILDALLGLARDCAEGAAERIYASVDAYRAASGRTAAVRHPAPEVLSFGQLLERARTAAPGRFEAYYAQALGAVGRGLREGSLGHAEATRRLAEAACDFIGLERPAVVVGFVPPYYPSVSYRDRPEYASFVGALAEELGAYGRERFGLDYELEAYFTGISDLSYSALGPAGAAGAAELEGFMARQMPLYGRAYAVPFAEIHDAAMPCINVGPWGKDFHKLGERVLKEDAFQRAPALLLKALAFAWGGG